MRESRTSGSTRGSDGRGVACNSRPSLSTLLALCEVLFRVLLCALSDLCVSVYFHVLEMPTKDRRQTSGR